MSNIKFNHNFQNRQFKRQLIQQRQNKQNIVFDNILTRNREQMQTIASVVNKTKNISENLDLSNVDINVDVDVDVDVHVNNYNLNYIKSKIMADYGDFYKK